MKLPKTKKTTILFKRNLKSVRNRNSELSKKEMPCQLILKTKMFLLNLDKKEHLQTISSENILNVNSPQNVNLSTKFGNNV